VWLSIAKLIVVSYWKNADLVVAVLCSFGFSLLYWRLTKFPARMQTPEEKLKRKALLRSVFRILKPYFWPKGCVPRLRVASTWVFLGISKAANIASPLMVSLAVQQLTAGNGVPYFYIILFTGLTFVSKAAKECQSLVYLKVKQTAFAQVAEFTFVHLHSLSLEWHLKKKMGQVLRAMDRGIAAADNVVQYLCLSLFPTLVECVFTLVIFWAHFKLPILAAVAMLSFAMYCWLTITITLWRKKFREQTNRHDNAYHDKATDSLVNYETVKYFANEDWERKRYVKSISDYQKFTVATQASLSLLNLSQQLVIGLCLCLGLFEASYAVLHGGLPVGDFVAVQIYIAQLFTPLTFLGTIYGMVVQATIDMQNLSDMLTERPDVNDEPGALPIRSRYDSRGVELEFQKVAFHYPEQPPEQGLQEISFVTPAGTTTAIVGHTGAGKTTISRLLFRFYDVTGGRIMIDGQNVASVTQGSLRKLIGMVPQDTVLFNDTIQYNIKYGNLDATFEELESAAASAQILDFIRGLPNGWDTMVGERGLKLSGGEKQRVAIARCLLKDPSLVVLDEATSALDTRTEKEVQTALQCLKGRTTVVIAHRLSTVRSANQIIVLGHGCVLEHGTHDELIQKKGEYYAMCQAQIENGESSPGSSPSSPVPPDPADGTAGAV
jgi:ABC-type transport system involved in Fe-S cluster assembly fused permease/ATPase subunit